VQIERREDEVYERIVVVLNETQDLVNIAGTVRAILNMGLSRLRLVRPAEFDPYRITGIAHGSEELVERIEFFDTLYEAVADTGYVVGTTARKRTAAFLWEHPRTAAPKLLQRATETDELMAIVFGREDKGLSNEDLDLCDKVLTIPTAPAHSSLNLAQTVLLVAYELWIAGTAGKRPLPRGQKEGERPANVEEMSSLFLQTEKALQTIDFFKTRNPAPIMRTIRAVMRRAELDTREARLLRAIAYEIQHFVKRMTPD